MLGVGVGVTSAILQRLSSGGGGGGGDLPALTISGPTSQLEGNSGTTSYVFTVTRTGDLTGTSTVNWSVTGSGVNAASAQDFA